LDKNRIFLREPALGKQRTAKARLTMVIDSARCFNCQACVVACQLENRVPVGYSRNWVKINPLASAQGMHFQPGNCMHCDKPTCVEACPTGATFKDSQDGVVRVNKDLCIGCGSCIPACPYGARYRHPKIKIVDKCDYCESRRRVGKLPACVTVCPTRARVFGDLNDPESDVARLHRSRHTVRVVNPETDTDPAMYYLEQTAPMDWTVTAEIPLPIQLWRDGAGPLIKGLVALSGLGVLAMLARQLIGQEDRTHADEKDPNVGTGDGD
jgi:Fe-S-cluster-containing dehydrogenase component